jgi:hypothetical protein
MASSARGDVGRGSMSKITGTPTARDVVVGWRQRAADARGQRDDDFASCSLSLTLLLL